MATDDLARLFEPGEMLPLTRAEAMSVPAVARGRTIVCASIARLPLNARPADWAANNGHLLSQPEPDRPRFSTIRDTVDDLLFLGSAVWEPISWYATGKVSAVRYLPRAAVSRDSDGAWRHDGRRLPDSLIWFDGPHDGILLTGARSLRAAVRLDRAAAKAATNSVPAAELHQITDDLLTDDEIKALCRAWDTALSTSSVAYTSRAVELRTHGAQPEQLLLTGRNLAAVETARLIGLPAPTIDAVTPGMSGTYQSTAERGRELVDYGLAAYMAPITARLSLDDILPRGVWADFDTDPLTRLPLPERMAAYAQAIAAGILTPEECRAIERGQATE